MKTSHKKHPRQVEPNLSQLLVRLADELMVRGIGYGEFSALMKAAFVTAAIENLEVERRVSVSGVAVMTGLDRNECQRIMHKRHPPRPARGQSQRVGRVEQTWRQSPKYNPLALETPPSLPLIGEHSLDELIRESAGDVPAVSVRRAMVVAGMLRIEGEGNDRRATLHPRPIDAEMEEDLARRLRAMTEVLDS